MAAMVGPVGIHKAYLGDGGVAMLTIPEIPLQKPQVVQIHCKAKAAEKGRKTVLIKAPKGTLDVENCFWGNGKKLQYRF